MVKRKLINKKDFKKIEGRCRICKTDNYAILDVHRINGDTDREDVIENRYTFDNAVCLCANCHRIVHSGKIVIDRYYPSTSGRLLRILREGVEDFV